MDPISRIAAAGAAGAEAAPAGSYVDDLFSTYLYEGNNTIRDIDNGLDLSGEGGLVWTKQRDGTEPYSLSDTERGAGKTLRSNSSIAEYTDAVGRLRSFSSNGYQIGNDTEVNQIAFDYVSWAFLKAPGFFDIVTYTGTGLARTVSHNLGSVPGCIMVKATSTAGDWWVFHRTLGPTKYIGLDSANGAAIFTEAWDDTSPTSTEFTVGKGDTNTSGTSYVAYIFAHDEAVFGTNSDESIIKCGNYTGTGVSGNAVSLGFEPQWLLIKRTNSSDSWKIFDTIRGVFTEEFDRELRPNVTNVESFSTDWLDVTATGFTLKFTSGSINAAGSNYIYMAIRRPHKPPTTGTEAFAIDLYSGSSTTAFEADFPPDLAFIKNRSVTGQWFWVDRLRGENALSSHNSSAEQANVHYNVQIRGAFTDTWSNYIGWMLKRAPGFFDIVAYTGNGTSQNISHNLSAVPKMMIVKRRDRPGDVVKKFNASNVIQEMDENGNVQAGPFTYEGTGRKARKTVALVSWNDPEDRYRTKLEYVEDRQAIDIYGYRELEVRALGCTSQGQAQRIGRWALVTNLTEKETVTFRVTAQGFFMMPGEIIEIQDDTKTAGLTAGIVQAGSSTTQINVDTQVSFTEGVSYELVIGSEVRSISTAQTAAVSSAVSPKIVVSSAFSSAPDSGEFFLVRTVGGATPRKYRVVGIMESEDGTVTVTASSYNEDKYDTIDLSTFFDASTKSIAGVNITPKVFKGSIVLRTS